MVRRSARTSPRREGARARDARSVLEHACTTAEALEQMPARAANRYRTVSGDADVHGGWTRSRVRALSDGIAFFTASLIREA